MQLNRNFLSDNKPFVSENPVRAIQFGEGNFIRAFVDWMLQELNKQNLFNGQVIVVQPISTGKISEINSQNGLYTVILRGIENGKVIEKREINSVISHGIDPYQNWQEFLECANNPELRFIFSNTTEAGISYCQEKLDLSKTPLSFPAKLAALLYQRFNFFNGAKDKGLLIFPCELVESNGSNLKRIILQLSNEWDLPAEFTDWLKTSNHFFNTLVDRIVSGFPHGDADKYHQELGYDDKLLDIGEIFHLWVIEGDKRFATELPLTQIGLNVKWVKDLAPYRDRKVRVLNGAHTAMVPVGTLSGLETVREAITDPNVGKFIETLIFDEILPFVDLPETERDSFAKSVLERFQNPFIHHRLLDIALNSISKFKTRCLPTIIDYCNKHKRPPPMFSCALAALIAMYKEQESLQFKDEPKTLEFIANAWSNYDTGNVVTTILGNKTFWEMDLNTLQGFTTMVTNNLVSILKHGVSVTLTKVVNNG